MEEEEKEKAVWKNVQDKKNLLDILKCNSPK
jgi:hypothetical protein